MRENERNNRLLAVGWISLYRMVKDSCGSKMQKLAIVPAVGAVGMSLFHGNINCIEPLVYKTLVQSGSESMFPAMDTATSGSFAPVDLLILAAFYLQLIILISRLAHGGYWRHDYRYQLKPIGRIKPDRLIDIGCGPGAFLSLVEDTFPDIQLNALDLSEEMISETRERLSDTAIVTVGDAEHMPFESE